MMQVHAANNLKLNVNTKQMTEDDGTFHHPTFLQIRTRQVQGVKLSQAW